MRPTLTLMGALLLMAPPSAQAWRPAPVRSPDPVLEQWRWRSFNAASGLAGRVYDLHEDRSGHIWLATDHGAQRYDGYQWTTYTTGDGLSSDDLRAVTQTRDGSHWFAASDGTLSRLTDGRWETFQGNEPARYGKVTFCQTTDGQLLAGYSSERERDTGRQWSLVRFGGGAWEQVELPAESGFVRVNDVVQGPDGSVWVATERHGVLRHLAGRWSHHWSGTGEIGDNVSDIMVARDGTLWFVDDLADGLAFARFDGRRWRRADPQHEPDASGWPVSLWQTPNGVIWAGDHSGPMRRLDDRGWRTYAGHLISAGGPLQGRPTAAGQVWLFGRGREKLLRLDVDRGWTTYTHPDGLHGGIEASDGSVWFHSGRRAVRFARGQWTQFGPEDGFLDGEVVSLHQTADGDLWFVGTHLGRGAVCRYDGATWRVFDVRDGVIDQVYGVIQRDPESLNPQNFRDPILQARDGSVWFAGRHQEGAALARFDGRSWTRYTAAEGLSGEWISLLYETSDGAIWAGAMAQNTGFGLFRFDGGTWQHFGLEDGLPSDYVTGIGEWPDGTLWVGTKAGVSRLDLDKVERRETWQHKTDFQVADPKVRSFVPTPEGMWFGFLPNRGRGVGRFDGRQWRQWGEADGLADASVSDILRARDGAVWFVGQGGISRYDGATWTSTTRQDGLELGWLYPTLHEARDGSLWIDDSKGSVVHLPFRADPLRPQTAIEPAPERVSSVGNILLRWKGRDAWAGTPPEGLRYQWRLDGGEWSAWSSRADVTYTELAAGPHHFEVQALDFDAYRSEPATHDFVVQAPWWRTPWVVGLTVALAGLVALQSGRVVRRDRRLAQQNRDLMVERTLERLRAEVLSMTRTEDFLGVVAVMGEELRRLGVTFQYLGINVLDEATAGYMTQWIASATGEPFQIEGFPGEGPGPLIDHWRAGTTWSRQLGLEDKKVYLRHDDRLAPQDTVWVVDVPYKYGTLALNRGWGRRGAGPFDADEIRVLSRFGQVISLAYTRFLDFHEVEQQSLSLAAANRSLEDQARQLHEARDAAEAANRAKSQFLANMSHEIRTPMNAVLGYAQILRRSADLAPCLRQAVETIQRGGDHLLKLINDVLDLSKIEAGGMALSGADFDLHDLLRGLAAMFELQCSDKGLQWRLEGVAHQERAVHGDAAKLRQVLINLLGNAVKFTDRGGVALRVAAGPDDHYRFEVCDTGPGLGPQEQEAVFQPFQQGQQGRHRGGTGLGLTISQRQIELMGGHLRVESPPGAGATFAFDLRLPPASGCVEADGDDRFARVVGLADGVGVRALVADDVEDNRQVLATMLRELGLEVDEAVDGGQALGRLQARRPDIAFLDVRMPVMDGLETVGRLRRLPELSSLKVVATSASALEHEKAQFLRAGFDDFVGKPFRFERICACLTRHLAVSFVYADGEALQGAAGDEADWGEAVLPSELYSGVREAAELYSVTEMEGFCRRLEEMGRPESQLATHLRGLTRRHDMKGILSALEEVRHG